MIPRLAHSELTDLVYIVTKYEEDEDGYITAIEKFDVTDKFWEIARALALPRREPGSGPDV